MHHTTRDFCTHTIILAKYVRRRGTANTLSSATKNSSPLVFVVSAARDLSCSTGARSAFRIPPPTRNNTSFGWYPSILMNYCGGGGIRTLGALRHTRFPSVRTRPLCDASVSVCYIMLSWRRETKRFSFLSFLFRAEETNECFCSV